MFVGLFCGGLGKICTSFFKNMYVFWGRHVRVFETFGGAVACNGFTGPSLSGFLRGIYLLSRAV